MSAASNGGTKTVTVYMSRGTYIALVLTSMFAGALLGFSIAGLIFGV